MRPVRLLPIVRLRTLMTSSTFKYRIEWVDDDLTEVTVIASDGRFSGEAMFYAGDDDAKTFAKLLAGFPATSSDRRDFVLGDPKGNYGSVVGKVYCVDPTGRCAIDVEIRSGNHFKLQSTGSAKLTVFFNPGILDSFVAALSSVNLFPGQVVEYDLAT